MILVVALVIVIVLMVLYLRREKRKESIISGMYARRPENQFLFCMHVCPAYYDIACYTVHAGHAKGTKIDALRSVARLVIE